MDGAPRTEDAARIVHGDRRPDGLLRVGDQDVRRTSLQDERRHAPRRIALDEGGRDQYSEIESGMVRSARRGRGRQGRYRVIQQVVAHASGTGEGLVPPLLEAGRLLPGKDSALGHREQTQQISDGCGSGPEDGARDQVRRLHRHIEQSRHILLPEGLQGEVSAAVPRDAGHRGAVHPRRIRLGTRRDAQRPFLAL